MTAQTWTTADVAALPVTVDIVTAGEVIGLGRSASYEMARTGAFPVPVLRLGRRYRVVTAHLRDLLGVTTGRERSEAGASSAPAAARTHSTVTGARS
jgi:hypothetical protein